MMIAAGGDPHINDVELVSLDEKNHPVPNCLKTLKSYPIKTEGAFGWAMHEGKWKI